MIISICASHQSNADGRKRFIIMSNDVKRTYFYGLSTSLVYIRIPKEDWEDGDEDKVGMLNLSLYETRDAALNWANTYTELLRSIGFNAGKA